jgi:hypothetical protein
MPRNKFKSWLSQESIGSFAAGVEEDPAESHHAAYWHQRQFFQRSNDGMVGVRPKMASPGWQQKG